MKPSFSSTKIFSCLLISLVLSSCGGYKYQKMESYTQESFAQGKKGVVFFDIAEGSLSKNASLSYILVKLEEKDIRYMVNVNSGFSDFFSLKAFKRNAAQSLLYLDPGIYYIDYISLLDTYNATRWLPSPGYKDNYFLYGAFEIKSGQVVNIGQLVINGELKFNHTSDIDLVKKQLIENKKGELAGKIIDGNFYQRGSVVFRDKDKHYKLLSSTVIQEYHKKLVQHAIEQETKK